MLMEVEHDTGVWAAILVFFGSLFLLIAFPFYPTALSVALAFVCGGIAYKHPSLGVLLGLIFAFPSIAYQSPILAWMFLIPVSLTLFSFQSHWANISFLELVMLAPFAPFPFSLISPFIYLAMALASLYVGSRQSVLVSLPSIFLILLLSSFWLVENGAFFPINLGEYTLVRELSNSNYPSLEFSRVFPESINSILSLFSLENMKYASDALGHLFNNTYKLLILDTAIYQVAAWGIVLFIIGYIPGMTRSRHKQLIASLPLLAIPVFYFFLSQIHNSGFNPLMPIYIILSIAIIGALEHFDVKLAREAQIRRAEKTKQFGKFGIQDLADSVGAISLDDLGGYEDVKAELREAIVTPLEQKGLSLAYGIKPPSGVLLFGPPGTGKTLLMRALSKELSYGFYYIKCSDLLSQWYGESEKNLSEVFTIARKNAPCILFFDEIDSIGKKRTGYSSDDVGPRLLSLFLEELDGFKTSKNVITIGATNIPNQLDSALIRPGRLDKIIYMHLPDPEARKAIFKVYIKKLPIFSKAIDYGRLASLTERFSGADIANVCSEAARLAARDAGKTGRMSPITMEQFTNVLSQVKPSVSLEALSEYDKFRLDFERRVVADKKKEKKTGISWKDVAGLENVKTALKEALEIPLLHEDLIKQYKIKPSKGLLMFGPPGCGKTLILKAAAGELNATFLTLSGAELTKKGYEYAVQIIKETFNRARENSPALIFIDEIESIAPAGSSMASRPFVSQLLTELDGVSELKNVMLVGATNKPYMLDPAILRPGRFDKVIYVPQPDIPARAEIFRLNVGEFLPDAKPADFRTLASLTEGFSGADISSVCQEAKMSLVRKRIKKEVAALTLSDIAGIIKTRRPSITQSQVNEFMKFMSEYGERK